MYDFDIFGGLGYHTEMEGAGNRKNIIIKSLIVVIVLLSVSFYIFAVRVQANTDAPAVGKIPAYRITFFVDGIQRFSTAYNGAATQFPEPPKKDNQYFIGWYIGDSAACFDISAYAVTSDISLNAKFKTYTAAINDFLASQPAGQYTPNANTKFTYFSAAYKTRIEYQSNLYQNLHCCIIYNLTADDGTAQQGSVAFGDPYETTVTFTAAIDYSKADSSMLGSLSKLELVFDEKNATVAQLNAQKAGIYYSGCIALAVESLIHEIANRNGYKF